MQALLESILDEVRPLIGLGKVADYIPALADVPADQLGIAVYGNDGAAYCAGDADTLFSVQSISKVFSLVQAIDHGGESIWERWATSRRGNRSTRWCNWNSNAVARVTPSSMPVRW